METIERIRKKLVAAIIAAFEQHQDGLTSTKEKEDQLSWAGAEYTRELKLLKKLEK